MIRLSSERLLRQFARVDCADFRLVGKLWLWTSAWNVDRAFTRSAAIWRCSVATSPYTRACRGHAGTFPADVRLEQEHHVGCAARASEIVAMPARGLTSGPSMSRGYQFAFHREPRPEPLELVPQGCRLGGRAADGANAAELGGLLRHEPEMAHHRNALGCQQAHRIEATSGDDPVPAPAPERPERGPASRSSSVTSPPKSIAAVTNTRLLPCRTSGTDCAMHTTISMPAASAAAASSALPAVTWVIFGDRCP